MVFKWRGAKVDHLMADPKQARQLIEELPANEGKALEEITYWLESIRTDHRNARLQGRAALR